MSNNFIPKSIEKLSKNLYDLNEYYVLLKFKDKSSDKFWAAIPEENNCIVLWGKNGHLPQNSQIVPKYVAEQRVRQKISKGYLFCLENEFLKIFKTNPRWFLNFCGNSQFSTFVNAQILELELEKTNHNSVLKNSKLKI